ncbi:Ribonuclease R [Pseudovibrio axinellae]|uniref:Ribonuclease R n=1 Tax=Pseudovibrio axinellae TaxID=989403 RepID=A0A161UZN9_9HYPH|nr:ribonuclease R [Pseudovibrio axinellae]KZL06710.1 Ribonuclease R [Pseudovibrio axinellae]SER61411.1 RNAse R [Pseudovibrio axinellae]
MPSREDILKFIADNPGKAGKREIARHFGIVGAARIPLKHMLKDLAASGQLERRRKRLLRPGDLPPVFVVKITGRTADGELLGIPLNWDKDHGDAPLVLALPQQNKNKFNPVPGIGDKALVKLLEQDAGPEAKHCVRVMKRLENNDTDILGILRINEDTKAVRLEPIDRKQREVDIDPRELLESQDGDLVKIEVHKVGKYGTARGKIVKRIGSTSSEMAVSEIALHTQGIRNEFPGSVTAESENVKPATSKGREDWRDIPLITIDPATAKDHDDAVYAQLDDSADNEGGCIVYVAIADVAAYVTPGSPLDKEALLRGNSVYFPDRVIPMLPERISNNLCSLRENEDRPSLATRMVFDKNGKKISHSFHRVIMRSAAKLSYQQAQKAIEGVTDDKTGPLLETVLQPLWAAYEILKRGRDKRQPLELDIPERRILLKEDGTVDQIVVPERLDAHKLIEECMIQANVSAAEELEKRSTPLLYRIHDASTPEKLENLRDFLSTLNVKLPHIGGLRAAVFNNILDKFKDTASATMVSEVVLRSQAQAEYNPDNIGHFGLNLRRYAHFTSPIRRYADLIVHRALIRALKLGDDGLPYGIEEKLPAIAAEISGAERRAMLAERETIDRLIALYLCDRIGAEFQGRIAGVTKSGLFVKLLQNGADGFIPASTIGMDYYEYVESAHALVGRATGETYQLGDAVQVKLVEAAPFAGSLRFEMLTEGKSKSEAAGRVAKHKGWQARNDSKPKGLRRSKNGNKRKRT